MKLPSPKGAQAKHAQNNNLAAIQHATHPRRTRVVVVGSLVFTSMLVLAGTPHDATGQTTSTGTHAQPEAALVAAAQQHDPAAMQKLADVYYYGSQSVKKDAKKAAYWAKKAADKGNGSAMYRMAVMYKHGKGVVKNSQQSQRYYQQALQRLPNMAEAGDFDAMFYLGNTYLYHTADYAKALQWFHKGVGQYDSRAAHNVGYMYKHGYGVAEDNDKAQQWYLKAVSLSQVQPQTYMNLAELNVLKDETAAKGWYEKAAAQGHVDAMLRLGELYDMNILPQTHHEKALYWYTQAAEKGSVRAMMLLGETYRYDLKDAAKAQPWYDRAIGTLKARAAEQDDQAMMELALFYQKGWGVASSAKDAQNWYTQAAQLGNVDAMMTLGQLNANKASQGFKTKTTAQAYEKQAMDWYKKAADKGHVGAMYKVGMRYKEGTGAPKDSAKALQWLTQSAELSLKNNSLNNRDSDTLDESLEREDIAGKTYRAIADLYKTGDGVAPDQTQAMHWYEKCQQTQSRDKLRCAYELGHLLYAKGLKQNDQASINKAASHLYMASYAGYGTHNLDDWTYDMAKALQAIYPKVDDTDLAIDIKHQLDTFGLKPAK